MNEWIEDEKLTCCARVFVTSLRDLWSFQPIHDSSNESFIARGELMAASVASSFPQVPYISSLQFHVNASSKYSAFQRYVCSLVPSCPRRQC
jgi:hypothetical protein